MKFTLAKQIGLLFALLTAVVFSETALVYQYQRKTQQFGRFASLTGRQTFLAQRLELHLDRRARGGKGDRETLIEIANDLDETLDHLEGGGEVDGPEPPPIPQFMSDTLRDHRRIWDELHPILVLQIGDDSIGQESVEEVLERAQSLTHRLIDSSFKLDQELENWRRDLEKKLRHASMASNVVAVLIVLAAVVLAWQEVVSPLKRIKAEISRVMKNEGRDPSKAELNTVAELVSEMTADVDRLRSERHEVEEELRHVEADYRVIFLNAVAGILQISVQGRILVANPALARILGYESVTDLMASVDDAHRQLFVDPEHMTRLKELNKSGGGTQELETRVYRKDGSILWVLESISMAGYLNHSVPYYEGVLVDITPRKQAEESLRELSGLLLRSQEEERRRIGRELHDSTGQLLAALSMSLDRLQMARDYLPPAEQETLTSCVNLAELCSRDVRSVSHLLHPPLLEELGLTYALRDYVEGFEQRSGIQVELELPDEMDHLSLDAQTALFRFVQEALTNVHRHADSPRADIRVEISSGEIRVEVLDHGRGLLREVYNQDTQTFGRLGVGLRGMKERLRQLGGRLHVETGDWGTLVRAEVPISEKEAQPGFSRS